jgi:hypothetical protein
MARAIPTAPAHSHQGAQIGFMNHVFNDVISASKRGLLLPDCITRRVICIWHQVINAEQRGF